MRVLNLKASISVDVSDIYDEMFIKFNNEGNILTI